MDIERLRAITGPVPDTRALEVSIDSTWLFLSLLPSGAGFVLFTYGRKRSCWPYTVGGLLFMVYPYFAPTVTTLVAVGLVLSGLIWLAVRLDW
jgi:hypothetical protein